MLSPKSTYLVWSHSAKKTRATFCIKVIFAMETPMVAMLISELKFKTYYFPHCHSWFSDTTANKFHQGRIIFTVVPFPRSSVMWN